MSGVRGATGRQRLLVAAAWIAIAGGIVGWAVAAGLGPAQAATRLVDALQDSWWGPLAFVAIYLARPLILFSAALLTVAGGFLFGAVAGIGLVVVASNGSALVAYGIARWLGAEALAGAAGGGRLERWTGALRDRSFETVLVMRLIFLPYDLVSYVAGAARIRPLAFLAGTALGSAPATVALVLVGASADRFDGNVPRPELPTLLASGILLVAGLAVARILRRRAAAASGRPGQVVGTGIPGPAGDHGDHACTDIRSRRRPRS